MTSAWLVEHSVDSPHPQPLLSLGNWDCMELHAYTMRFPLSRLNTPDSMWKYPVARRVSVR